MSRGRPAKEPRLILAQKEGRTAIYVINWHDGERQRTRSKGTGDRRAADEIFAQWLLDQKNKRDDRPLSGPRYPHEVAIADILRIFAEHCSANGGTCPERQLYAIKRLLEWWDDRHVDAISPDTCEAYGEARYAEGIKPGTVIKELSVLRAALKWAKRRGRLISVPDVELPPKPPGKDRYLTRSEAARLLWAARKEPKSRLHLPLFILIALYTGARSEAILTLKWFEQVDFEHNIIDFNQPGRAKTKKGRAAQPMPRRLRWFLEKAFARASGPYVLNYHGEPIKRIKHSFASACKRAGLLDVTPHTLRHTRGTWLRDDGVPLDQIGGWLGHSDPRTTEIYAHRHPGQLRVALAAIERKRNANART
jgi:integrase